MKIKENVKKILIVLGVIIATVLLIIFAGPPVVKAIVYLFGLVSPFVFGYILARAINPLADRLQKWLKIPRGISAIFVIILTVAVVFGLFGLLGYKLFEEVRNLIDNWPELLRALRRNWNNIVDNFSGMYIAMPDVVQDVVDKAWGNIYKSSVDFVHNIPVVDAAQAMAKSLPPALIWIVMFVLSMYFMVTQKQTVTGFVHKTLGERAVIKIREIKEQCKTYLGGYVKAQGILMLLAFMLILIILSLFNAPYAVLIAAITAFLDALPFFGSGLVLWPMAGIYFIDGNITLGIVYIATYFAVMLLRRFIEPKLVSDKIGVNPLVTLVAMFMGYKFWGIIGLITGPLLLMLIISLYKVGLFRRPIKILKQLGAFTIKEIKIFGDYLNEITK